MDKQRRALNFKPDEIETLVALVEESKDVLFGRFSSSLTKEAKEREWQKIASAVSAVSGVHRDAEAVKKKIITLTSQTKKKAVMVGKEQKKTGGGSASATPLTPAETRVLGLVSPVNYEGKHRLFSVFLCEPIAYYAIQPQDLVLIFFSFLAEKKQKQQMSDFQALLEIEREKLELCRQRLRLEKERLALKREKFEWEKGRERKCSFEI
ncbi:hypothetical protein ACEWY4_001553 [Coilia grayii]|uniref:Myb/SANT-like DNA-binding domain-containing protein n=1 Tax=Coilia grayii TaxID=363190 RepID=A0ABD1KT87_9TELE